MGDRLVVCAEYEDAYAELYLATMRAGGIAAIQVPPSRLRMISEDSKAKFVHIGKPTTEMIEDILANTNATVVVPKLPGNTRTFGTRYFVLVDRYS